MTHAVEDASLLMLDVRLTAACRCAHRWRFRSRRGHATLVVFEGRREDRSGGEGEERAA